MHNFGFSQVRVFENSDTIDINRFQQLFKQRVIDCFIQEWLSSIGISPVLEEYKYFKSSFHYESYLDILHFGIPFYMTRIRISAHSLRIQTGRF